MLVLPLLGIGIYITSIASMGRLRLWSSLGDEDGCTRWRIEGI